MKQPLFNVGAKLLNGSQFFHKYLTESQATRFVCLYQSDPTCVRVNVIPLTSAEVNRFFKGLA